MSAQDDKVSKGKSFWDTISTTRAEHAKFVKDGGDPWAKSKQQLAGLGKLLFVPALLAFMFLGLWALIAIIKWMWINS
jgi:hypothetical protein